MTSEAPSPSEARALELIRSLPEGPVRDRALHLLEFLSFYVQEPRCQGMGVEGFPCDEPRLACEECQRVWDLLAALEQRD
jgi:hypothetical protein